MKRRFKLIYEVKGITPEEKLTWTLPLLQECAARVATHTAPSNYRELMSALTTRFTDGHDEFHCRVALCENCQTGSIEDYVDCFLYLYSKLPNLADGEAKYALTNGLTAKVQMHLLVPVPSPEAHRRGATSTTMDRAIRVCTPHGRPDPTHRGQKAEKADGCVSCSRLDRACTLRFRSWRSVCE